MKYAYTSIEPFLAAAIAENCWTETTDRSTGSIFKRISAEKGCSVMTSSLEAIAINDNKKIMMMVRIIILQAYR